LPQAPRAPWPTAGLGSTDATAASFSWRSRGPWPRLRGHVFTGFPWNPLAYVWAFAIPLLHGAALVGVYGLGTLTFLVLAAPVAGWRAAVVALASVGMAGLAGEQTMTTAASAEGSTAEGPMVRIVQPNVAQAEKGLPRIAPASSHNW
jgi:apolipoprotein N-acyltransferase